MLNVSKIRANNKGKIGYFKIRYKRLRLTQIWTLAGLRKARIMVLTNDLEDNA